MGKIEVALRNIKAGNKFLIKGEGELILPEELDTEIKQTAIFHARHYSQDTLENWYTVNLWTGLFISSGSSKKKCLEEFENRKQAYFSMLNNPDRVGFFKTNHEELEKLKTQAIS